MTVYRRLLAGLTSLIEALWFDHLSWIGPSGIFASRIVVETVLAVNGSSSHSTESYGRGIKKYVYIGKTKNPAASSVAKTTPVVYAMGSSRLLRAPSDCSALQKPWAKCSSKNSMTAA